MEGILLKTQSLLARIPSLVSKQKPPAPTRSEQLIRELNDVQAKLRALESAFDLETDFDRIDAYALEIEACKRRYSYLIKCAKREHITAF